jgi:hypothetical protein
LTDAFACEGQDLQAAHELLFLFRLAHKLEQVDTQLFPTYVQQPPSREERVFSVVGPLVVSQLVP